ncbi:hypothetical protein QO002_006228 [Pararhizobium capsulatum DSM 1112]|uniref:Transposase n=1 Tax=Pararhizobium capsulatum DSM 1112 TaxID=1121113 RepID=A0ABU0C281_9HYPH|nr:hypothetical protein [Pararhizobium capsulatum DSM 1112]
MTIVKDAVADYSPEMMDAALEVNPPQLCQRDRDNRRDPEGDLVGCRDRLAAE